LRFQDGLNDVSTFAIVVALIKAQFAIINVGVDLPAQRNLHWIILGLDEQISLLKSLYNSDPDMEALHALITTTVIIPIK